MTCLNTSIFQVKQSRYTTNSTFYDTNNIIIPVRKSISIVAKGEDYHEEVKDRNVSASKRENGVYKLSDNREISSR